MTSTHTNCYQTTERCLKCGQRRYAGFTQCDKHMNTEYKCRRVDKRTRNQEMCQKCLLPDPTQAFSNKRRASRAGRESSPGPAVLSASSSFQLSSSQLFPIHEQPFQETYSAYAVPFEAAPYSTTAGISRLIPTGYMLPLGPPWGTGGTALDAQILSTMSPYNMPNDPMLNDYNTASGIPAPTLAAGNVHSFSMYTGFEGIGSVAQTAPSSVPLTLDTLSPGSIVPPQPAAYEEMQPTQQG